MDATANFVITPDIASPDGNAGINIQISQFSWSPKRVDSARWPEGVRVFDAGDGREKTSRQRRGAVDWIGSFQVRGACHAQRRGRPLCSPAAPRRPTAPTPTKPPSRREEEMLLRVGLARSTRLRGGAVSLSLPLARRLSFETPPPPPDPEWTDTV
uniref:Uncharacterized protein n=1 Tax=Setaria italica TaxID=4555 RepID=A0A0Q3RHL2_SETIT